LGSAQKFVNDAHLVVSRLSFEAHLDEGCSRNETNKGTGASEMLKIDFECPLQEGSRNEVSGSGMSGTEGRGEEVMQEVVLKTSSHGEGLQSYSVNAGHWESGEGNKDVGPVVIRSINLGDEVVVVGSMSKNPPRQRRIKGI